MHSAITFQQICFHTAFPDGKTKSIKIINKITTSGVLIALFLDSRQKEEGF
jgi:hypothetical protein